MTNIGGPLVSFMFSCAGGRYDFWGYDQIVVKESSTSFGKSFKLVHLLLLKSAWSMKIKQYGGNWLFNEVHYLPPD